jgi:tetratricopeptide (TPR) repeat protein
VPRHLAILALSAALPLLWTIPARADEAREKYEQGLATFDAGQYIEAATAFREAYALKPSWKILYNLGQSEAAAKRYGLALEAFEDYLAAAGDELTPDRRESVLAEVERLRRMVGFLAIEAPDGVEVSVDGVARGTAPLSGEIPVSIGPGHEVVAARDGDVIASRTVKVFGGKTITLDFRAGRSTEPGAPPPDEAPRPADTGAEEPEAEGMGGLELAGWVTLGAGGAMLIAAVATGSAALSIDGDLDAACAGGTCSTDRQGDIDRMKALGVATDVLIGVGAAAAATGAALLIYSAFGQEEATDAAQETALTPIVAPGLAGVALSGRF